MFGIANPFQPKENYCNALDEFINTSVLSFVNHHAFKNNFVKVHKLIKIFHNKIIFEKIQN
jgi:hypothetical protein